METLGGEGLEGGNEALDAVQAKTPGQVERPAQRLTELAPAVRNMERLAAPVSEEPEP